MVLGTKFREALASVNFICLAFRAFSETVKFCFQIPLGLSVAVSVRVRNALGKGDHITAKHNMKISIVTVCKYPIAVLSQLMVKFNNLPEL